MEHLALKAMNFFGSAIIFYMLLVILTYGSMMLFSTLQLRKQHLLNKSDFDEVHIDAFYSKPVSILVPAYNEEAGIIDNIHSLISLRYPNTEIIVINDGSTDRTQELVLDHFKMHKVEKVYRPHLKTKRVISLYQSSVHPNLLLLEKENGGKADSLNAGINLANYPFFCSIDGDSILEETALLRVMKPVMLSGGEVIAAGGNIQAANGLNISLGSISERKLSDRPLVLMQIVEYMRAFLMGRTALSRFNLMLIISGAFSVFSKEWVIKAGGYSNETIGEDMELIVKLHRLIREEKANKRVAFVPDPVCWTEAPATKSVLRRQRRRWHQGLIESLWTHRKMLLNPKYGAVGMVSFPYFWVIECLGPVIELAGYLYVIIAFLLGDVYIEIAFLLLMLLVLYSTVFSVLTVFFEAWVTDKYLNRKELLRFVVLSLTEVFWYRPLTLFWRCEGLWHFIRHKKEWGMMNRIGIAEKESEV